MDKDLPVLVLELQLQLHSICAEIIAGLVGGFSVGSKHCARREYISNSVWLWQAFAGIFPGASYINVICHFAFDKKNGWHSGDKNVIYSRAVGIIYIYCLWIIISLDDERVNNGIIFNLVRLVKLPTALKQKRELKV